MRLPRAFSAVFLLAGAATVQACSSCSVPDSADGATSRGAYYGTALFLTLLPFLLVVLLAWWLRRQVFPESGAPNSSRSISACSDRFTSRATS